MSTDETVREPRLRRSVLAVPGNRPDMAEKAAAGDADEIFLDLEDAVPPDLKAEARDLVIRALMGTDCGDKTVAVRVNDVRSPWCHDDVSALLHGAGDRIDTLVVPKVEHPGELHFLAYLLDQLEAATEHGARIGVEAQVESGAGATRLEAISEVTDRLEALIFGPGDYAADLGIPAIDVGLGAEGTPGDPFHAVRTRIAQFARAVGAEAVDGPLADFTDDEGYRESARHALGVGFDGKWCIHPRQVPLANEVFTPSHRQVSRAAAMLAAYEEALAAGQGAATFEGAMIDEASRKMARRLIARGRAAGVRAE
ncbi:CoA ester lyase [Egibacter rhizosphaerae]|uniref:CoA ester lyase n=1 Tax=Egibacter rhizosphaerae TaxID=1670831 RepID=A0A411YJK9_9ACTN|nr:CoA ester lyase [Egibacter rhizosphaerae]QBI21371.1 CoA ester lyase [Egibacter rhizosphaerae]